MPECALLPSKLQSQGRRSMERAGRLAGGQAGRRPHWEGGAEEERTEAEHACVTCQGWQRTVYGFLGRNWVALHRPARPPLRMSRRLLRAASPLMGYTWPAGAGSGSGACMLELAANLHT